MSIAKNVQKLLLDLPAGVQLVAAVKGRQVENVVEAVQAGIKIIGENYLQETGVLYEVLNTRVQWHFIGHLQKNKVKKAINLFDMIETVDSVELASEISRRCIEVKKQMPVLIEINSGCEIQKHGVFPQDVEPLIKGISHLPGISVVGLMTMGPFDVSTGELRSCFHLTREVFEKLKKMNIQGIKMEYLSMGMSDSFKIAIEEGANVIRVGSKIFSNDQD